VADPSTVKYVVTIAGAFAELLGLSLVAIDVRARLGAARDVAPKPRPDYRTRHLRQEQARPIRAVGGSQATQVRLDKLEDEVWELRNQMADVEWDLPLAADRAATHAEAAALQHADRSDDALRSFLSDHLASGRGRSLIGTLLFAAGVVASAVANLI
jgi:hypothetical protein